MLDKAGKITSGTFMFGEGGEETLADKKAENVEVHIYDPATGLLKNTEGKYLLGSAKDFLALDNYIRNYTGEETLTINAILTDNIDMSKVETVDAWPTGKTATGIIDGQDKVIHHITATNLSRTFLFKMNDNSTVKDVNILTSSVNTISSLKGAKYDDVLCVAYRSADGWDYSPLRYGYIENGQQKSVVGLAQAAAALTTNAETTKYNESNDSSGMKRYLETIFRDFID